MPTTPLAAVRLVSARWVFPIATPPITDGAVALAADDSVVDVGPRGDLRRRHPAVSEQRAVGALLPGLVNAHTHLELTALAGRVPGGDGLVPWAAALMRERAALTDAGVDLGAGATTAAALSVATSGTAAVGDTGNSLAAVPAIAAAGLRGVVFHELVGSREARTGDALADAARELDALTSSAAAGWPAGLGYVPSPHAPYSVGADLLRRIFGAAARAGVPTSIHLAEDADELALLRDGSGRWPAILRAMGVDPASRTPGLSPVAYIESLGAFATATPPLLVHLVHTTDDDRRRARAAGATAVLCPRSNLHIGGRLPDVTALLRDGIDLAVGTDSLASTPDVSLWGELCTLREHFPAVTADVWLTAATRGGAEALRLPRCGALAPGKRPGVLDVDVDDARAPLESLLRNPRPTVRWVARA